MPMHITNFQAFVYTLVLLVALWVILFRPEDTKARAWAYGIVSVLLAMLWVH
jgi:hypothetical protein